MNQNVAKYWYSNEKMVVVPVCLNGSNKDEGDESLPLLAFPRHVVNAIFLKD